MFNTEMVTTVLKRHKNLFFYNDYFLNIVKSGSDLLALISIYD